MTELDLSTVGHGTLSAEELGALLTGAGVCLLVDVRRVPGSRRHPHVARAELARWLPPLGVRYRWEEPLGGRRTPVGDSRNTGLRNASFRAYADHMTTPAFRAAMDRLVVDAAAETTAVMCSETLWWRCHRRLLADHAVLVRDLGVRHLVAGSAPSPHVITDTARRDGDVVVYDGGGTLA